MEEKLKVGDGAGTRPPSTENVAGPGIASLQSLAGTLEGELYVDKTMRTLYATDAYYTAGVTTFMANGDGEFATSYNGQTYGAFIDSGSNGLYFPSSSIAA